MQKKFFQRSRVSLLLDMKRGSSESSKSVFIPGLTRECFVKQSHNSAPTPKLVSFDVKNDTFAFTWIASGSLGDYEISARGSIASRRWSCDCSCPDGERQQSSSNQFGRVHVCKHGEAALMSVLDKEAEKRKLEESQKRARIAESIKMEQERVLPGERARIEKILKMMTAQEIEQHLRKALQSSCESLKVLGALFPAEECTASYCFKCKQLVLKSQQPTCRVRHENTETRWEGSKKSFQECMDCGKCFGYNGYYNGDELDEGSYCYQGSHVFTEQGGEDDDDDEEEDEEDEDEDDDGDDDDLYAHAFKHYDI